MCKIVKVIVITGPTATGKTALAVRLARQFDGEIISVDSRQVYRSMDIGTGKDLTEYGDIPRHLIDVVEPDEEYNLACFLRDAYRAVADVADRGKLPVLCGGSAMYLDALLRAYRLPGQALPRDTEGERVRQSGGEPESFTPPFALSALVLGVYFPRETVRSRIEERLDRRLADGLTEEVAKLHERGISWERLRFFGLEYREVSRYLENEIDFATMRNELLNKIRQFAKRQDIFFRKMERAGVIIHWLDAVHMADAPVLLADFLAGAELPPPKIRLQNISYGKVQPRPGGK